MVDDNQIQLKVLELCLRLKGYLGAKKESTVNVNAGNQILIHSRENREKKDVIDVTPTEKP